MVSQDHRVVRLESDIFGALTPAGRVREVLRARAEGNENLASRIIGLCPVETYRMTDFEYRVQCECAFAVFMHAYGTFEKYAFGYRLLKGLKDLLVPNFAGVIAYDASTLVKCAMLDIMIEAGAGNLKPDWSKVDEAIEKAQADASITLAQPLTGWKDALYRHVRAEWAGFDAFCQSQFHLDGWTFVKGWNVKLDSGGVWTWVQHVLSEPPPENQSEETDKVLKDVAVGSEAACREVFLARLGKSGATSGT